MKNTAPAAQSRAGENNYDVATVIFANRNVRLYSNNIAKFDEIKSTYKNALQSSWRQILVDT
jgi:hypothetical protein